MKNALGREIPEYIKGYGPVKPFENAFATAVEVEKVPVRIRTVKPGENKVVGSLEEAIKKCNLSSGMTISFHHHLRNGDNVLNMVVEEIARQGIKNIKIAATAIFPVHAPLIKYIQEGVVTGLVTSYISGPVAQAISEGLLDNPIIMQTHGGRARSIESGDIHIDVAFIAASACDCYGNMNGVEGKSAFGVLGYPVTDAFYSDRVVAVTDNLVPYPAVPIEISQENVDFICVIDSIGDVNGIVSGTTKLSKDPIKQKTAKLTAQVIESSGILKDGFSFQTGAGGTSLLVASYIKDLMRKKKIRGSFAAGGITKFMVEMLEEGLFEVLLDAQCFDLRAVESYRNNKKHQGMSASMYANPHNKGAVVNNLDVMILGATEIDTQFNVNVTTNSNGVLMGGSGGHSDTAAGAKLAIVVTELVKKRFPIVVDKVTTVTTPGETVDILVTERGIAVNPRKPHLFEKLKTAGLPLVSIEELKNIAQGITGIPEKVEFDDKIVAVVEYRDGTVIDVVRKIK